MKTVVRGALISACWVVLMGLTNSALQAADVTIKSGDVIRLRCLEYKDGPRRLSGHTVKGFVDLAEDTNDPPAGVEWLLEK
jgi:hypothetical protein